VYELDSSQREEIFRFVSEVNGIKEIIGYADTVGTVSYNRNLSRLRALYVYLCLSSRIKPDQSYSYRGEEFFQSPALSLNRKVEIVGYKFLSQPAIDIRTHVELVDSFDVENINFIPDRDILTPESNSSIPQLIRKIKSYQNAHFDIVGHVNYQSRRDSAFLRQLYELSEARAKVIYQILVENGIPEGQLTHKGVGNSQPLIRDPKNDQEKMKNMRVQILVYRFVRK
jgi:outer membrane protein OmpA-like peptidoglycan-associated protein